MPLESGFSSGPDILSEVIKPLDVKKNEPKIKNLPTVKNRIRDEYTSKWTSLNGSVVSVPEIEDDE